MIPLLFSIILSGDVPHDDHAGCQERMFNAVEILMDHDLYFSGWCSPDGSKVWLSADTGSERAADCHADMMGAVDALEHELPVTNGWCALDGHTMGPDELAATEPTMRPKRSPVYGD